MIPAQYVDDRAAIPWRADLSSQEDGNHFVFANLMEEPHSTRSLA
jgi:hypothetical protein